MKNKGTTIVAIIALLLCFAQGAELTRVKNEIEVKKNEVADLQNDIERLEGNIRDLEDYEPEINYMDSKYTISGVDYDKWTYTVEYTAIPLNLKEVTKITLTDDHGNKGVELEKQGDVYAASVEYPISDNYIESSISIYEGKACLETDELDYVYFNRYISSNNDCTFEGDYFWGNGRLTLAGNIAYKVTANEAIKSAEVVFGEEREKLDFKKGSSKISGEYELNKSAQYGKYIRADDEQQLSILYVEVVTESGFDYKLYPLVEISAVYDDLDAGVEDESDVMYDEDEYYDGIEYYQNGRFILMDPERKVYTTEIFGSYDEEYIEEDSEDEYYEEEEYED